MALFKCDSFNKTGSLYEMTSNNTPSPYIANRGSTNVNCQGEPYIVFRSAGGNVSGSLINNGDQAYCQLRFNKLVRIKKMHYHLSISGIAHIYHQYIDKNGDYVIVPTVKQSGEYEEDIVFSTPVYAQGVVLGVRKEYSEGQVGFSLKQLIVTEWK
ncbi:MAG: hypothetical protein IJH31_01850 [Erysipelotrichaceae bacterium]|nr:hypothetical protein [Erysipelotrichaceae bacterium]